MELTEYNTSSGNVRLTEEEEVSQPFVQNSSKDPERNSRLQNREKTRPAWFVSVAIGLGLAIIVLAVNIGILAWVRSRFNLTDGDTGVVFTGSCSQAPKITAASELAINILSTLLLTASNNCAQLLVTPSRDEVDEAHSNGAWLQVGVAGVRNFRWISWWRIGIWAVLFASSVPLHLMYNSVIFSSSYTNDYMAAAVTENFLKGGFWNETVALTDYQRIQNAGYNPNSPQPYVSILQNMQSEWPNYTKLDNDECQVAFGTTDLQSPYLNVLLVTNYTQNDSFIDGAVHYPEWGSYGLSWFNVTGEKEDSENANSGGISACSLYDHGSGADWSIVAHCNCTQDPCVATPAYIQNCFAQPAAYFDSQCTISISTKLLLAVIICNGAKAICLAITLLARDFHPLATVGDAICSLMERSDPTTAGCGPVSVFIVRDFASQPKTLKQKMQKRPEDFYAWAGKTWRWGNVVSTPFCVLGLIICIVGWLIILIETAMSFKSPLISSWSHNLAYSTFTGRTGPSSLVPTVLLINTPQLIISLIYVFYNGVLSRMVITAEISQFAYKRRGLRVSRPSGSQRSTFWLQLPYRYIIPAMASMTLIHFFVSRGIYLVNIKIFDITGQEVPERTQIAYATSGLALLLAFLVGTIMLGTLFYLMFKKLHPGMPILGTCSLAISAACHVLDGVEDVTEPLMYGVISGGMEIDTGKKFVGFSRLTVEPLMVGSIYA